MKSVDVISGACIEFCVEKNNKDLKFKFGNHEIVSNYSNNFAKDCTPNWSEEIFLLKKVKNIPWTYVISDR